MEKFNPSYSLTEFKNSHFKITQTAQRTALELEFDEDDVRRIVSTMELKHFYKSMTSYANHRIWHLPRSVRKYDSLHKIYAECYRRIYFAVV